MKPRRFQNRFTPARPGRNESADHDGQVPGHGKPGRFDHIDTSALDRLLLALSDEERQAAKHRFFRYIELVMEVADRLDGLIPPDEDSESQRFDYDESRWEGQAEGAPTSQGHLPRPLTGKAEGRTLVYQ